MAIQRVFGVAQHHIDEAVRRDSRHCAIQNAMQEAMPGATCIQVDLQTVRWTLNGTRYKFLTPPVAQRAILAFDRGAAIAPFRFTLRGRPETYKAGWRAQRSPTAVRQPRTAWKQSGQTRFVPTKHREYGLRQFVER